MLPISSPSVSENCPAMNAKKDIIGINHIDATKQIDSTEEARPSQTELFVDPKKIP